MQTITTNDVDYINLESKISSLIANANRNLFTTDTDPDRLWNIYLGSIPQDRRQHYNCNCCRRFIQEFGGLVEIENGITIPLIWAAQEGMFEQAVNDLNIIVGRAKVTGTFHSEKAVWGVPQTKGWTHLHGVNKNPWTNKLLTASQKMAEQKEEYRMLREGLAEFKLETLQQAVRILKSDSVVRAEKSADMAEWLLKLKNAHRNVIWAAVATAPAGWCHVKSGILGTLLEDIQAGKSMDVISRSWSAKMHPLKYQRPTAEPLDQAIEVAEKLVSTLGIAKSLERRFATLNDILRFEWLPREEEKPANASVFGHLKKELTTGLELPAKMMTWEKFRTQVLPMAQSVEVMVPSYGGFYGLLTATYPEAPPIIQWDQPDLRNPVSWYLYHPNSSATRWSLTPGYQKVNAIFLSPHQWLTPDKYKNHPSHVHFAISSARDTNGPSIALFPEILKSELHGVRKVIEAHMKTAKATGTGDANGYLFNGKEKVTLRVTDSLGKSVYTLDRMD